jgi:hypothetical protein
MHPRRSGPLILVLVVAAVAYFAWLSALAFADPGAERGSHEVAVGTGFWLAAGVLIVALWFFGVSLRWWAWIPVALWLPALVLVVAGYSSPTAAPASVPTAVSTQREETQPVATTATTTASLPSPPPAPPPMRRCTEDGIRYAGRGPEGVRVCFTLTRDRSAWLEISFGFIPPGECGDWPGQATYFGPPAVSMSAPGRIDLSFGDASFTALIDGAKATGYFTDPDTCGSKLLDWNARRVR